MIQNTEKTENISEDKPHLFKKGQSGNPFGRPKTTKSKKEALKQFKERVRKNIANLLDAQFNLAMGCSYLFVVKKIDDGKKERQVTEKVTDPEIIEAYLNNELTGEDEYYYISTEKPDNRSIDSLLDRTFGKAMQNIKQKGEGINAMALLLKEIYERKEPLVKQKNDSSSFGNVEQGRVNGEDKEQRMEDR